MSSTHPAGKAPQDTGGEQSAGWLPGRPGRPDDEPRCVSTVAERHCHPGPSAELGRVSL